MGSNQSPYSYHHQGIREIGLGSRVWTDYPGITQRDYQPACLGRGCALETLFGYVAPNRYQGFDLVGEPLSI